MPGIHHQRQVSFVRHQMTPLRHDSQCVGTVQKVTPQLSYCTLSKRGMEFTERIFSTVQTRKMQTRVAYEFIHTAVQSWIGGIRPPSLVPEHIHLQHPA